MFLCLIILLSIPSGTESAPLVKPDLSAEIAKVTQYFQDMSKLFTTTSTELVEKVKAYELTSKAEWVLAMEQCSLFCFM